MLTGRSEAFAVNGEQKTLKSFSSSPKIWKRCSNSRNSPISLSLNRCDMFKDTHGKESALHHLPWVVSPTMTVSTWTHIHCHNTASKLCCAPAAFCSSYSSYSRSCIHSLDLHSNTGLPFCFMNCSITSHKSKKRLGLTILPRCGKAGRSCGLYLWEGCQTDGDSSLWIEWN